MGRTDNSGGSLFAAARVAEGLSQKSAAESAELSEATYVGREKSPDLFRLAELRRLFKEYGPDGRRILMDAIESLFLS